MIYSFERINIWLSNKVSPNKRYDNKGNWHLCASVAQKLLVHCTIQKAKLHVGKII